MALETFSNDAETLLNGAITNSQLTITVDNAAVFPQSGQYRLKIDDEYFLVTGGHGTNILTVVRGQEGSTAVLHADNAEVHHVLTAGVASLFLQDDQPISIAIPVSTDSALAARVVGDTQDRISIESGGHIEWGSGSATRDMRLRRNSAGFAIYDTNGLSVDSRLWLQGVDTYDIELALRYNTDTIPRVSLRGDSTLTGIEFGPGGAVARDIILSRAGAGLLSFTSATPHLSLQSTGLNDALLSLLSGTVGGGVQIYAEPSGGGILFGSGGGFDTDLFRSSGGVLATSGDFAVSLGITADNLRLTGVADAGLASVQHAFQIGPTAGANLVMDPNELMARNNGAVSALALNADGGEVSINANAGSDGLRVMRGGIKLGTTSTPTDDVSMLFGADVELRRSAANVLSLNSGDRFDNKAVGILIRKTTSQSLVNNTLTRIIAFTTTDRAGFAMSFNPYGGSEIRCDVAGLYVISVMCVFAPSATGRRAVAIMTNNAAIPTAVAGAQDYQIQAPSPAGDTNVQLTLIRDMAVNDTIAVGALQQSGGALNVTTAILSATRIGT